MEKIKKMAMASRLRAAVSRIYVHNDYHANTTKEGILMILEVADSLSPPTSEDKRLTDLFRI